jgi:hypothetical protein
MNRNSDCGLWVLWIRALKLNESAICIPYWPRLRFLPPLQLLMKPHSKRVQPQSCPVDKDSPLVTVGVSSQAITDLIIQLLLRPSVWDRKQNFEKCFLFLCHSRPSCKQRTISSERDDGSAMMAVRFDNVQFYVMTEFSAYLLVCIHHQVQVFQSDIQLCFRHLDVWDLAGRPGSNRRSQRPLWNGSLSGSASQNCTMIILFG